LSQTSTIMTPDGSANDSAQHSDASSDGSHSPAQNGHRNFLSQFDAGGIGPPSRTSPNGLSVNDALATYEKQFLPSQPKSLSKISGISFLLGIGLALSLNLTVYILLYTRSPLWRIPHFGVSLSLFHFLEFYTTARYNTRSTDVSSFLLSSNWPAFQVAHASAMLECLFSTFFHPNFLRPGPFVHNLLLFLGLLSVVIGQIVRSAAMKQAGTNFNHIVQHTKRDTHQLVTTGVYRYLRHPSYFGFFWWGIGTQLVLGNVACLMAYAYVLWRFFNGRIRGEEKLLTGFFGDEYIRYRERTRVGIPFIK